MVDHEVEHANLHERVTYLEGVLDELSENGILCSHAEMVEEDVEYYSGQRDKLAEKRGATQ
jgi:hypothetical protein